MRRRFQAYGRRGWGSESLIIGTRMFRTDFDFRMAHMRVLANFAERCVKRQLIKWDYLQALQLEAE